MKKIKKSEKVSKDVDKDKKEDS